MYGHAYPSASMQQQGQAQGSATSAVPNNLNFANMMGMGGMAMDGQQQQQLPQDAPSSAVNGINPALMFNPQLQALHGVSQRAHDR